MTMSNEADLEEVVSNLLKVLSNDELMLQVAINAGDLPENVKQEIMCRLQDGRATLTVPKTD